MVTVGIRNLKNSLSQYINLVKSGEKVVITDHNKIVAELVPFPAVSPASGLLMEYLDEQVLEGSIIKSVKRTKICKRNGKNKYDESALKKIYTDTRDER